MKQLILWSIIAVALVLGAIILLKPDFGFLSPLSGKSGPAAEIEMLAEEGGDENVLKIVAILKGDSLTDTTDRVEAIRTLGRLGLNKALPFLKDKFYEGKQPEAEIAAIAIGEIGSKEALGFLMARLDHTDNAIFSRACDGLAHSGRPEALHALEETARTEPGRERKRNVNSTIRKYRKLLRTRKKRAEEQ